MLYNTLCNICGWWSGLSVLYTGGCILQMRGLVWSVSVIYWWSDLVCVIYWWSGLVRIIYCKCAVWSVLYTGGLIWSVLYTGGLVWSVLYTANARSGLVCVLPLLTLNVGRDRELELGF